MNILKYKNKISVASSGVTLQETANVFSKSIRICLKCAFVLNKKNKLRQWLLMYIPALNQVCVSALINLYV